MHEMGIANSVLESAHKVQHRYPGQKISKIGLRIGEFAGVDIESLRFCFDAIVKSEKLAPITLEIESCSVAQQWRGDELEIAYLELEEPAEMAVKTT
ncbi:MAG: hydrogenase maturation nickel metallochaperone HypA [Bryobacteraceae bacterium]|jgi:hydrogenase nickel incorporation protein HypA/HybF